MFSFDDIIMIYGDHDADEYTWENASSDSMYFSLKYTFKMTTWIYIYEAFSTQNDIYPINSNRSGNFALDVICNFYGLLLNN